MIDTRTVQETVNNVLDTLNDESYREDVRKTVDLAYSTSLGLLQRAVGISREFSSVSRTQRTKLLSESVPEVVKANLSMAMELMTLGQKYSSRMLDILEKNVKGAPVQKAKPTESDSRRGHVRS